LSANILQLGRFLYNRKLNFQILKDLENDDLKFSVDYRGQYTTVGRRWWGLKAESLESGPYPAIDFI
jgi:uncharacterized protein (DUF1501 family)